MLSELLGLLIYAVCLISLFTWIPAVCGKLVYAVWHLLGRLCWKIEHKIWKPFIRFIKN